MPISAARGSVENVATSPPEPPYCVVLTMTIVTSWLEGTCVWATFLALVLSQVSKRRVLPSPQKVESK